MNEFNIQLQEAYNLPACISVRQRPDGTAGDRPAARADGLMTAGAQLTCGREELQSAMSARLAESVRLISDLPAFATGTPRSVISELDHGRLLLTTRWDPNAVRPGGTWSGPAQFEIVDTAGFLLTIAHLAPGADALTISLGMQFLQPPPAGDLLAEARLLRMSARASVITVELRAPSVTGPVAHGTVSYACRPGDRRPS